MKIEKKYIIISIVMVMILLLGGSYAYFKARIIGSPSDISLTGKEVYVKYIGSNSLVSGYIIPGWSETKTFTIENEGKTKEKYNIYIENLINTFVTTGYLQYKITSDIGYNMTEYKDIPKSNVATDTVLAYSVEIEPKEIQTYTIELIYKDTTEDQSADMEKTLNGILGIEVGTRDPNLYTVNVSVINGTVDTSSKDVYKGKNVDFTLIANNGYKLEDASISCDVGESTISNNKLNITNVTKSGTCIITLKSALPTLAEAMLRDNPTISERTDFSVTNTSNTTGTIYKTNKTEDGSIQYYYSGNTTNNWVKFGKHSASLTKYIGYLSKYDNYHSKMYDSLEECNSASDYNYNCTATTISNANDDMYWRIIRTNEDGSVRLLYSGTSHDTTSGYIGTSLFISTRNAGYMYGGTSSLEDIRGNTTSSTIKGVIDTWYQENLLTNYDKYISKTAIYCNDRSVEVANSNQGRTFAFGAFIRVGQLQTIAKPTYKCGGDTNDGLFETTQATQDKFSASTTGGGNGQLTYPIALMTADEVAFAGGEFATSLSSPYAWYYTNSIGGSITGTLDWWLMSPHSYDTMFSYTYYAGGSGNLGTLHYGVNSYTYTVRPAISISPCAKVKGTGTATDPYVIDEVNSICS